jgi:uncharacterized protein YyaL (SSP411 family)
MSAPARNRLAFETSPYLQQHARNPVDWYPWGEAAFARARELNRPVHLSVGYFACHWCHVMAHECFEDPAIARQLNENFINIKVDRQERPDVDDVYQRVVQMMGQSGGWPLTVFLTPEQEPFFAGTYFPPEDRHGRPGFPRLLQGLSAAWESRQSEVRENCAQFARGYADHDARLFADAPASPGEPAAPPAGSESAAPSVDETAVTELRRAGSGPARRPASAAAAGPEDRAVTAAQEFARNTDPRYGGLGSAPKFPNPSAYDLVLRVASRNRDAALLEALTITLDRMAAGGIHDHLGGGFARYSVDERWDVPHFEKMLYDNGQLVKLYADAYRQTGRTGWRQVFEKTIGYVLRDLRHPEGGFFASEDADSDGGEGLFYTWTTEEVRALLGDDDALFACHALGIRLRGNFEGGRSVPQRNAPVDAADLPHLEALCQRLFTARLRRARPARDENILTGWNGLMIQGLCAAHQATGDPASLDAARGAADFLARHLDDGTGGLYRAWRDGVAKVPGFLEDYAFLANGLFDLYESDFRRADLDRALALVDQILERFWDDGLYFTPREAAPLIHRPLAPFDNAWPSGISEAVLALFRAQAFTGPTRYGDHARRVLEKLQPALQRNAFGFAHLIAAGAFAHDGPVSIVFTGGREAAAPLIRAAQREYQPARVLALAADVPDGAGLEPLSSAAAAYVCRNGTCLPPVTSADALRGLLT